eukprot:216431_1
MQVALLLLLSTVLMAQPPPVVQEEVEVEEVVLVDKEKIVVHRHQEKVVVHRQKEKVVVHRHRQKEKVVVHRHSGGPPPQEVPPPIGEILIQWPDDSALCPDDGGIPKYGGRLPFTPGSAMGIYQWVAA